MIKKETMLENINKEIEHLNRCIDLDDDTIKNKISEEDENFLYGVIDNGNVYLLFSKHSHLYTKHFKL